jgi:formylglycine-generating enzyme required for sulfatase activity
MAAPASQNESMPAPLLRDFVDVDGGSFLMGSEDGRPDEAPVHRVQVRPFSIARLPVTNREYAHFLKVSGAPEPRYWHGPGYDDPAKPVVGIAWEEALHYTAWITHEIGRKVRLPTEAEWEYAALAGRSGVRYPWGDGMPQWAPGVPLDRAPLAGPAPAGLGPINPWGIGDLGWNIHEWCSDWYAANYYAVSTMDDPQGPASGERRASRGGAWRHQLKVSRCTARSAIPPALRDEAETVVAVAERR